MKDFLSFLQNLKTLVRKHSQFFFLATLVFCSLVIFGVQEAISFLTPYLAVRSDPFPFLAKAKYPVIERNFLPDISAQAAFIMDNTSRVVLFAKNENVRLSPASTTKIMTALTALDYYGLDNILTVDRQSQPDWSVMGLYKGEQMSFEGLLYGMMLPSGNDAAYAIADNYPGGVEAFVNAMNTKAHLLHLDNTHFADPVGLKDDQDFTTAHDLGLLASFAITHPFLAKVVATEEKKVTDTKGQEFDLQNLNKLLGYYGVVGIKTGYTDEAGQVLVTSTVSNGHTFILVVMKSQDRFADMEKMLQFISQNVSYVSIGP